MFDDPATTINLTLVESLKRHKKVLAAHERGRGHEQRHEKPKLVRLLILIGCHAHFTCICGHLRELPVTCRS